MVYRNSLYDCDTVPIDSVAAGGVTPEDSEGGIHFRRLLVILLFQLLTNMEFTYEDSECGIFIECGITSEDSECGITSVVSCAVPVRSVDEY